MTVRPSIMFAHCAMLPGSLAHGFLADDLIPLIIWLSATLVAVLAGKGRK